MTFLLWISAGISIGMLLYLGFALLFPERLA